MGSMRSCSLAGTVKCINVREKWTGPMLEYTNICGDRWKCRCWFFVELLTEVKNCYWVWSWSWHLNPNRKPMGNCWRRSNTMQTLLQNYHSMKGIIRTSTTLWILSNFSTDVGSRLIYLLFGSHLDGWLCNGLNSENYFQMQPSLQVDLFCDKLWDVTTVSQNPLVYDNGKRYPSCSENWNRKIERLFLSSYCQFASMLSNFDPMPLNVSYYTTL